MKPIALAAVYACRRATDLPIVGMGGVWNGRDALEFVAAGASAVALGTVLFTDPGAPARVREELRSSAESLGLVDPWEGVGIAHEAAMPAQTTAKIAAYQPN